MNKNMSRKRALAISSTVVLLCMSIIVGMTWALFTDTQSITTHLQAGDLDITLKRVALTKTMLTNEGYLVKDKVIQSETNDPVDFTNTTTFNVNKNVFNIGEGEVLVPGSKYTATMRIENHSSVAFGYWIEIVCEDPAAAGQLAEQILVTVNNGQATKVGDGLLVGGPESDKLVGKLATNKNPEVVTDDNSDTFTVTIEFKDESFTYNPATGKLDSVNDDAQGRSLSFDLVVYAVQLTDGQ